MTLRTNARIAGVTLWVYFVAGIASLVLAGRGHATDLLSMVTSFSALVVAAWFIVKGVATPAQQVAP